MWNGNNYNTTGTYQLTLVNNAGCDSIATLNLTVIPTTYSTTDTSICESQLPLVWNGNNYNATGVYQLMLVNVAGCDSVATLNLTVHPTTYSTTDTSICESQLPLTWNGNSYNTAGTYTVTLLNAAACDSIATLNLTVRATTYSTTDSTICESQLPLAWNGNNYAA